ncbi:MAG: sugar transferase [Lachnospiraceae bacterium]|nr:sugar transferase [Lachnospiraceae bacterium]
MKYFTKEIWNEEGYQRTAGIKARDDVDKILEKNGYTGIEISMPQADRENQNSLEKAGYHLKLSKIWNECLAPVGNGDVLVIQFPIVNHSVLLASCVNRARRRGAKIILLIHDLEILRAAIRGTTSFKEKIRLRLEEETLLRGCDGIIVHNSSMKRKLASMGIPASKMTVLGIFDYLIPTAGYASASPSGPVVIAGALRPHKAGYAYHLPEGIRFNLYGVGYEAEPQDNVNYLGSFEPDQLPEVMEGSFGLVWDGETTETCSGTYGEYLRINNPHKASLYLASGMPVIIWSEAALAGYITRNGCGITVDSIEEIPGRLRALSAEEYEAIRANTMKISERLRKGKYTTRALRKALGEEG